MRSSLLWISVLLAGPGCDVLGLSSSNVEGEEEGYDQDDCKIEGDAIGQEGIALALGAKTITFHDWIGKTDSPGEFVGFSLSLTGGTTISYVVKAGGETYPNTELSWINPNGTEGARASGISNVDACEECEGDSCDGGGDGEPPPPPPPDDGGVIL